MKNRLVILTFLVSIAALFWFLKDYYPTDAVQKGFASTIAITTIFIVFRIIMQGIASKGIHESKARYTIRKTAVVLFWVFSGIIVLRIWIPNPQALLVAYGLVGAGVAVALQDFFKNFVGGIIILASGIYRVGDRIQVGTSFGDVIDVSISYTTLMEMKEWVDGDQATGRICIMPNGKVLSESVHNYTKDHEFIWDEIKIPITYNSDWKEAREKILSIVRHETKSTMTRAESEIGHVGKKYYMTKRLVDPAVYITLTDNWIAFNIRYVTDVKQRRMIHNQLTQKILEEIQKSKNIHIASATLNIVGFPDVKVKR